MQETPKAVYDKLSGDVTLYYDDIDHSGDNIRVWNITEEAFISVKEVNSIIIDSSFKDATQYYDPEQSQLKPLTKAHE